MSDFSAVPLWGAILIAILAVAGGAITLIGTLGLVRLRTFYERVHAPTLGSSLGCACILAASMLLFSMLEGRLAVHEVLIFLFVTVTTPVTLMLLARAALYRDRAEGTAPVPPRQKHGPGGAE